MFYRLPPNGSAQGLAPASGVGQYTVVVGGALLHQGQALHGLESVYLSPDEPTLAMTAGEDGAEVLQLQFPPLAEEYRATAAN